MSVKKVYAYIVNALAGINTVSVVDTSTNKIIATIPVGTTPQGVAFDDISCVTRVYITNYGSNSVSVIDARSNKVIATISVGNNPVGAITAKTINGLYLYVANSGSNTITVIDTATNAIVTTINSVQFSFTQAMSTCNCANRFIYVTNSGSNTVSVIDTDTNTILTGAGFPIVVGNNPGGIATTPNCSFVYVSNISDNTVSKIATVTNTVVGLPIIVGTFPFGVTITPNGSFVYVVNNGTENVSVIRTSDDTVTTTIPLPFTQALGSAITPDGAFVYVTDNSNNVAGDGRVDIIRTADNTVIGNISGFSNPVSFGLFIGTLCSKRSGIGAPLIVCIDPKYYPGGRPSILRQYRRTYSYMYTNDNGSWCYKLRR